MQYMKSMLWLIQKSEAWLLSIECISSEFPFFNCDQAALRTLLSDPPSVYLSSHPSVCYTVFTRFISSYHHEISGVDIVNWTLRNKLQWNFNSEFKYFHARKCTWICRLWKRQPFCLGLKVLQIQYSSICLDNGLVPCRHQAIIWTNDG